MIDKAKEIYLRWINLDLKQREAEKLPSDVDNLSIQLQVPVEIMRHWGLQEELGKDVSGQIIDEEEETRGRPKLPTDERGNYDSSAWLRQRTHKADLNLIKAMGKGNTNALKLYYQLTGQLVEKQEVKFGLNADEINRRNLEADRIYDEWLNKNKGIERGTGQGVENLPETPRLLSKQTCPDTEQEHGKDS